VCKSFHPRPSNTLLPPTPQTFCYMQLIGFVVLISGTMVYNQIVRVPGFTYPEDVHSKLADEESDEYAGLIEG